jgi:hypothetical protein
MPDPKKKLNLDLSGYKGGSKLNLDLSGYSEVKKKEDSQSTVQESVWGSNSQQKDVYTSLVTDQQKPQQESDTSNGPVPKMRTLGVDITAEEALKPAEKKQADKFQTAKPYIKKTQLKKELANTKVTAKNQDEVNRKIEEVSKLDQQTKQIEKERFDRIEQDFVSSKDEASAEVEAEKRLQDLLSNTGIWNKTKTFAKNAYNTVIEGMSSNPLNSGLLGFSMDIDPLSDEKKLVRQQAAKEQVKLSEQEILEKAKQVYKDKQVENIETDRINSFLDDLPEDDKLALKQDRLNTAVHLKEENLKNEKAIQAYAAFGKQKIDEYKEVETQLKALKEKGIAFPQDLYDRYTSLYSDIQNISKNIQKRQDSFLKNKSDLGTVEQEFDFLKRQYGDVENLLMNTGLMAQSAAVGLLGGLDYAASFGGLIGDKEKNMSVQRDVIAANDYINSQKDLLRKPVESVESVEGLLNYFSDVASNQIPNLVVTSIGAKGLAAMGTIAAGQKYAEMNQEVLEGKASYTPIQMATAPLAYMGFEIASELPTLSILKKSGRVLDAIVKNQPDLLTKTAFKKGKEFARDFTKDQLKEGGGEEFTNVGQNFVDRFILGKKNVGLLDNTGTVLKDTFTLTTMLKVSPHLAGLALKPFQSKVDLGLLDENARKIIEFSRNLNTLDLSDDERSVLENQIKKATEENSKIMANTIDNVANMPDSVYLRVNEINKQASKLKDDAKVINDGNLPNKASLLKDLENQYRDLQTERSSLINTKYSPYAQLESLPADELIDLKNEAQRDLMKELNPDGNKSITITDDQISKKALELYKSKQEQKTKEVTPVETTEVKTTVNEVAPVELQKENVVEETIVSPSKTQAQTYSEELAKTKESDPETYWSVSEVSPEDAAKGTIIDTEDGSALVKPDGDIAGVFKKLTSKAKGVAQNLLNKAIEAGGIKLDNFDGYLTKQYEKAGFRVVSRTPFNEQYAPEGWNKEKHGTPDVVAMVYDPNNELDIEEKTFKDPETGYDDAIAYRDGFVNQAKSLKESPVTVQEVIDESEKTNKLSDLVQKAKTALSKILPGTGIILYNTEAEYKAAINEGKDENSGGAFVGGKIHINPNRANNRTVAHEVFHAVLLNMVKSDPAAQRVTAAMITAIEKVLPPDMKAKLQDFVENGYDSQKELWDEEKLAELVGYLADNFPSLSQPAKNIIKEWLDQLAKLVGIKEFTDKEVIDFMNTLSGKVASGEVITNEDVKLFNQEGAGGFVGIFKISRQQNAVKAPKAKDDPRNFINKFVEDIDIREFNGSKFITNMYDYTNAGQTDLGNGYNINLFGGKGYVPYMMELNGKKIGDVSNLAAFNTNAQAETFIRNAEKSGAKLFAPHSGTKSQSWQFQQHTFAELVDLILDKNILTNKELIDTFNNSIKGSEALKDKFSKFSEKYGEKINDFSSFESDPKKIVELLDIKNNLSPDLRKALNNSIASNKKFQSAIGIKNKEEFYNRIMDPLNNGVSGGEIIGIVDFDPSTFEIVKTKPSDIDHHPSFGYSLLAKINGIYQPTEFYKSYDITDSYVKYNINGENTSIKSEDIDFDKKNVTSSAGAIPKVAEFNVPGRKQIIGEKSVKDKLVQNNLDTAKEMEAANKSAEDIFIATGWEKGADNKWKYDLQEGVVEFKNKKNGKASEVINYPELFKAYPKAKNIDIVFMNSDKFEGMYIPSKNRIMLSNSLSDSEAKSTLLHEVQHFIQHEEGFAVGGNSQTIKDLYNARIKYEKNFSVRKVLNNIKNSLFKPNPGSVKEDLDKLSKLVSKSDEELYRSIAGEVEAFNVEKRANMTAEERKATPISETADKPKEEQVVISDSDTMLKDRKQSVSEFNRELNDKEINLLRRSLRMKFKDSFVVEVLDDYVNSIKEDAPANNEATQYLLDNGVTLNRLANLMVEEGNFDTKSRALGYFNTVGGLGESVLSRKQANRPSVDEIYEESNKAIRDLEKTRGYKELLNDVYRRIFDRQKNIKDLMLSFGNTYAKNAYNRLVTKSGASGYASFEFKEAAKRIYGGLKKSDLAYLDKIIYAKRIKSINEKRVKEGRPLYKGMKGYSLEDANNDLDKIKSELGDKKFEDLNNRASEYFNEYRKSLRDLYDSGRISKETYDAFKNDEYSPIKTIKYILSPNTSTEEIDSEAKRFGMAKKDIMKLGDENDNAIIMDSKWLLATTINANKTRAFENKMLNEFNKAFESLSKEEKDSISDYIVENPVIGKKKDGSLKYKYDTVDLPNGFRKISFFENGNKKDIIIDKNYANQLLDVKTKYRALEILGTASGTGILRFFATGGNPLFIFGNVANDFQNVLYNTDVYSGFLPLATVQIARDFIKNFVKKAVLNDTYNSTYKEYLSHGGALDQMSRDGLQALESRNTTNKLVKGVKKGLLATGNFLSYLGNTSETAFRLAVYDKYKEKLIKEFEKQNGRTPNSQELDDIMWDAARESRETMPFDQGGDLAKTANVLMPYLNAGLQGIRKFAVFAAKNPRRFARNIVQYTAMSGALSATSFAMLLMGIRNDDEDDEKSLKEMIRAWQSVSNYEKANYHIFFTGNKNKDGEYEYYRIKKIPVFSILSTASEEALLKSFLNSKGVDYEFDSDPVKQSALKSIPFPIDVQEWLGRNPTAGALISYWANKDTFTGEKIFREPRGKKILPEAEVDNKTNQIYIDLGRLTGLSPAKSKVAAEKIITAETTNPAIPLMYSAWDGLFHKKDGFGKEVSSAMSTVVDAFGKKVVRYTDKNIINYKKQDELEYKEAVIETEIWKKEQKVYDEIKEVYSSGNKLDRNGFKKIIESNFDPIDREKYAKKYKAYINNMGSDREVLDIIFEDVPEVQAMKLNERYGNSFDEEERKELEEISKRSERPISRKALDIYYNKYKNRKATN